MRSINYIIIGFIAAFCVVLYPVGCKENKTIKSDLNLPSPETIVTGVKDGLKKDAENLQQSTDGIGKNATEGQKQTPVNVKPILDQYWINIIGFAGAQQQIVKNLNEKSLLLDQANVQIGTLRDTIGQKNEIITEKETKITKLEGSLTDSLRKNLHWLIAAGIIIAAVGGVLMFTGNKIGFAISVGGGILTALSLFISQTAQLIPWIVGGAVVIFAGFAIYEFLKKRKAIREQAQQLQVQDKAVMQIVSHMEGLKPLLTTNGRIKMFGAGPIPPQFIYQDEETKALVKQKRDMMPENKKATPLMMAPSIDFSKEPIMQSQSGFPIQPSLQKMPRPDIDTWTVTCADLGI